MEHQKYCAVVQLELSLSFEFRQSFRVREVWNIVKLGELGPGPDPAEPVCRDSL